ncbi:MAG: glycine dehydrogenase, partial [Anaerolineales bacterium]|nr:glycine dehydrogenase [Anaerolineales bacterium]
TYSQGMGLTEVGDDADNHEDGPEALISLIDEATMLVVVQYPDFFGRIYDFKKLIDTAHEKGALVCVVANPTALIMLKTPGEMGADIVVGEAQPFGIPLWYGGPYLGFFTTKKSYVHKMAGRLVGETVDVRGNRSYVLTLTAREQHIKRERATSNICTNQGLLALGCSVYMSVLGRQGLQEVANLCYQKAHYAAAELSKIDDFGLCHPEPFFHEFVLCTPKPAGEVNQYLLDHGVLGGYDLSADYPDMKNHLLVAVTEMNSRDEIDTLVALLKEM